MFLLQSHSNLAPPSPITHALSWVVLDALQSLFEMDPKVLNGVNVRGLGRPDKHLDDIVLKPL